MRINNNTIKTHLKSVPNQKRVWIYNADIIIEFLNQTFIPISFFLPTTYKIIPGDPIKFEDFTLKESLSLEKLYEYYLMFRQSKDYTNEIETKFKFGMIIKRLRFYKNNWEFICRRYGRRQEVIVYPLLLRVRATEEERKRFQVSPGNLIAAQVEVPYADVLDTEEIF